MQQQAKPLPEPQPDFWFALGKRAADDGANPEIAFEIAWQQYALILRQEMLDTFRRGYLRQFPEPIEVPLNKGLVALIDEEDIDLLNYRWCANDRHGHTYAQRQISRTPSKSEIMHRLILSRMIGRELNSSEVTDHINGNGLDNRRSNLRAATRSQNSMNQKLHRDSGTGFKGITRIGARRWAAQIMVDGKHIVLGYFSSPEEAHAAYCDAAMKYHGEFARTE